MGKIAKYEIEAQIGSGSMGKVYRAVDPTLGRVVALKVIHTSTFSDPEQKQFMQARLFREARSAAVLSHSNIVTVYEIGEDNGLAFIAMEYIEGPTLEQLLSETPRLDRQRAVRLLMQTAEALDYAHNRKIVHRDIKPSNILVCDHEKAKISDFGIAKDLANADTTTMGKTRVGTVLGTPSYMSPEQVEGKTVDGRSDQFALAAVTYECLTSRKPFEAENLTSLLYKILFEEPAPVEPSLQDSTNGLDEVLRKGLAKTPSQRYSSCSDFAKAVQKAIQLPSASSERPDRKETEGKGQRIIWAINAGNSFPDTILTPPGQIRTLPQTHESVRDRFQSFASAVWLPWTLLGISVIFAFAALLIRLLHTD